MSARPSALAFQLAGSGHAMGAFLDRVGRHGCNELRRGLRTDDRAIVPGYTLLLVALCALSVVWVRAASSGALEAVATVLGVLAGLLAVAAGVLDLLENRALRRVLDDWQPIPIPVAPDEAEAAERQQRRRSQVAAIDGPSRAAKRRAVWKWRLIALVLGWVLVSGVVGLTSWLSS
ncbi:hypothetical protein SFC79_10625 [Nocardioides sp. S-58]|uniref:Uncharacterized protein n=1 Tax=Nocardioides renjunii TaxID=3095075 RepID=A0ABU5KB68_9ACTN|nr:hypothetical protein [Nocardioides sp. S-58]MDZ5662219.1 hypothetical protein [Nocardioides sp. S-58]